MCGRDREIGYPPILMKKTILKEEKKQNMKTFTRTKGHFPEKNTFKLHAGTNYWKKYSQKRENRKKHLKFP